MGFVVQVIDTRYISCGSEEFCVFMGQTDAFC